MKLFYKSRGAISIFLIIILLPTMTIAGLFLDVSRAKMSQEVVTASADLALNTVLSSYDSDLKDYFGLLASCQNNDEAIALSKRYFKESMVSAGVATSEAGAYVDAIMDAFAGDDDISDMLQLSVDDEVQITPTSDGALDNPAMLKKEIIEFMKYRAPVNGVAEIFEKITDLEVAEQVENSSKEMDLIEAKKNFFDAEKKLLEQAEKAYEAIREYCDFTTTATGDKITEENFLNSFSSFLASPDSSGKSFEEIYKEAYKKMVMDLHNTHDTNGVLAVNLMQSKSIPTQDEVTTFSENSTAGAGTIEKLLKDFNTKMVDYYSKKEALDSVWNAVGVMQSEDYPIQYWVILSSECASEYTSYIEAAAKLWAAANKLENAVAYPTENAMAELMTKPTNNKVTFDTSDEDNKLSLQSVYNTLITTYNESLKSEAAGLGSSAYRNINTQLGNVDNSENRNKLELSNVSHIYNYRNTLNKYYNDFGQASELAKTAKTETNKLKSLLKKYKEAFGKWKDAAYDEELEDSELADTDKEEIKELEQTGIEKFSDDSVSELATRLGNIATLCKTFQYDIGNIKYKNTRVLDIHNYNAFRAAAGIDSGRIVRQKIDLEQYAEESFSFTMGTQIQRIEIHDGTSSTTLDDGDAYVITDSFHTNIEKTRLELYEWLEYEFGASRTGTSLNKATYGFDVTDKKSAKDANTSMEATSEETEDVDSTENTVGHSFNEWSGATLPSKGSYTAEKQTVTAKLGEVGDFVSSVFSDFSGTFMKSVVNIRDDLYMEDYIFEMFTYDTFEYEGCYELLEDKSGLTPAVAKQKYAEVKSNWESSKENQTLTLTPRNASNNWAYGSEVEYILYGNDTNSENKTTGYAQVYMIRYALDAPAVFQAYYNGDPIVETVALSLELFAHIPAELTKTLICLAITAAEAGIDINYLKAGLPVTLIKGKEDLICTYKKVFTGGEDNSIDIGDGLALQYSDYLKIFLFVKLQGSSENGIYIRTADVIQANMALSSGNGQFDLANSQVYYDLTTSVVMEPMWSRLLDIDNLGDLSTSKGWRTMKIKMTRGY